MFFYRWFISGCFLFISSAKPEKTAAMAAGLRNDYLCKKVSIANGR
jgi:hypothetical protein